MKFQPPCGNAGLIQGDSCCVAHAVTSYQKADVKCHTCNRTPLCSWWCAVIVEKCPGDPVHSCNTEPFMKLNLMYSYWQYIGHCMYLSLYLHVCTRACLCHPFLTGSTYVSQPKKCDSLKFVSYSCQAGFSSHCDVTQHSCLPRNALCLVLLSRAPTCCICASVALPSACL